jgi:hypothetical protein
VGCFDVSGLAGRAVKQYFFDYLHIAIPRYSMSFLETYTSLKSGQPLLVYELNEVPWRVIDWYVRRKPDSALARILNQARTFTTVTSDEGELHPWTTWPTLHRGVTNDVHKIRFINQSLEGAQAYPPVWETLQKAGKRVGLFGSLQSYPPPERGGYDFYVPDTFAPGPETWPKKYEAFQRFNLRQTQQDGAQAKPVQFDSSSAGDLLGMLRSGLRLSTCMELANHLIKERLDPLHRSRRSVLQALVAFDMFQDAINHSQPDFCTFFTNHVAGMMHRYWKYTFPEDFGYAINTAEDHFHAESIAFAMDIADMQIGALMNYVDSQNGRLLVATSMGQEAIERGEYLGEWRITNVPQFLRAIAWSSPVRDLLAMQPDFNFVLNSESAAEQFLISTAGLVDANGQSIWKRAQRMGATVNLGLAPSATALATGEVFLTTGGIGNKSLSITELGIEFLKRDPGTGYHQPRGALLVYGKGIHPNDARTEVDSTTVRPAILQMMGLC